VQASPVTDIDLTQFAEIVDNARADLNTGLVATSNDGMPDLSMRGSLIVDDKDHLAWWERGKRETYAGIESNPKVAVFVRNPTRDKRTLRFYGEARIVTDPAERERVWERVNQLEKDMDPQKQGIAVVMRVDRVRAGPADIQRR
jgi:uncharacterized pyridoxamine 5'-phosphate oxidase family protein